MDISIPVHVMNYDTTDDSTKMLTDSSQYEIKVTCTPTWYNSRQARENL